MTLRHMRRVKIIKTNAGLLYIIPFDKVDRFNLLYSNMDLAEFNKEFRDYRFGHIDEAELYVKESILYP